MISTLGRSSKGESFVSCLKREEKEAGLDYAELLGTSVGDWLFLFMFEIQMNSYSFYFMWS